MRRIVLGILFVLFVFSMSTGVFANVGAESDIAVENDGKLLSDSAIDAEILARINDLYAKVGNTYFNVDHGAGCGDNTEHGCPNCLLSAIINETWFKNIFGSCSVAQFPESYYGKASYSKDAYSCLGFSHFAQWYIFKESNSDYVYSQKIGTYSFNNSNIAKYAKIGDNLRLTSGYSSFGGHSAIYIGISSDGTGIDVLDCNFNTTYNCKVKKHTLPFTTYNYVTITRTTNRDSIVPDTEAPTISNLKATNNTGDSFTITCDLNDNIGVSRVWLNVYGPGGSNGYEVSASNGIFSHTINTADYGGAGLYSVHVCAFDYANNSFIWQEENILCYSIADMGSDFKAHIEHIQSRKFITNSDGTAVGESPKGDESQIWHFYRQNDGSYTIANIADYSYMEIGVLSSDGSAKVYLNDYESKIQQRFFIYYINGAYYIQPAYTRLHIDLNGSTSNIESWYGKIDWDPQKFNIKIIDNNGYLPVNIGEDIKAYIEHTQSGNFITNKNNEAVGESPKGDESQIWHFYRQDDGSYTIANVFDYSYMEIGDLSSDGSADIYLNDYESKTQQRFFVYYINSAYYIRPVYTELNIDFNASTSNIEAWYGKVDWEPQKFNIRIVDDNGYLPVNIGNDFKAFIIHKQSNKYITRIQDNVVGMELDNNKENQIWHFRRLADGSYTIANIDDYSYMEMEESEADGGVNVLANQYTGDIKQRFFIYYINNKYYFKPIYTNFHLDLNALTSNIELWYGKLNWESQEFDICKITQPFIVTDSMITDSKLTIDTTIYNVSIPAMIVVAGYKNGRQEFVQFREYTNKNEIFILNSDVDCVKVMLWKSKTSLKPLCETIVLNVKTDGKIDISEEPVNLVL